MFTSCALVIHAQDLAYTLPIPFITNEIAEVSLIKARVTQVGA